MTDRFYPSGMPTYDTTMSREEVWKTSYEMQNEMRSFQRSSYPPGYAGHEPGSREKFGFSTPGPDSWKLMKPELALEEKSHVHEPRKMQAVPRHPVHDDRITFNNHDLPERISKRPFGASLSKSASLSRTRSLPALEKRPLPPPLSQDPAAVELLHDDAFHYYVPKDLAKSKKEHLLSRSLSRLEKTHMVNVTMGGEGTGFRSQGALAEWWPKSDGRPASPSMAHTGFKNPPFYRMNHSMSPGSAQTLGQW